MKNILLLAGVTFYAYSVDAQIFGNKKEDVSDTIYYIELDTVEVKAHSMYNYNYMRYEYIVAKVYPLADTAVKLLNELEATREGLSKKKDKKRYEKELEERLRDDFEDRLKNLSRSQGEVLIDLIERNTGRTMYDILKDAKNNSTAFWWQNLGKFYGYDLKEGYDPDNNPSLEKIIQNYEAKHSKKLIE